LAKTKVAIFVDYYGLVMGWKNNFSERGPIPISAWQKFNSNILHSYKKISSEQEIKHMGTWVFAGYGSNSSPNFKNWMNDFCSLYGMIVKLLPLIEDRNTGVFRECGVDASIVSQMLVGAHRDFYDVAILVASDSDFFPAIEIIQNKFGKKVMYSHYINNRRLRALCFGSINLKFADKNFRYAH